MSKYTPEVAKLFSALAPKNKNYVVDVVEYASHPGLLFLQVYSPIVESLDSRQKLEFASQLIKLRDAINTVTPCDTIMVDTMPAKWPGKERGQ